MDLEKEYWNEQKKIYDSLTYENDKKYYSWQPARWAGNDVAINLISKYLKDVNTTLEIGAGSAAFSIALYNYNNNINPTAIDISPAAYDYANQILKDLNIPVNYKIYDLFKFNEKADLVLSLGVIEHYDKVKMENFIKKCIDLSNKYILICIPNQESIFFKNYVSWSEKLSKKYVEKHQKLTNGDLKKLLEKMNLKIILEDGFQVFLSESKFLSEDTKNNLDMINDIRKSISKYDENLASEYPNKNFSMEDIKTLTLSELNLSKEERMKYSFMTFILAEIK